MNEMLETMWKRRSVRKYKSDPIPEGDLNLIQEAARQAPTGGNRQKWRMQNGNIPFIHLPDLSGFG